MEFLVNDKKSNHHLKIIESLNGYDETYIAIAFLKTSGLNKLIKTIVQYLESGKSITLIAGQNFALTEPTALHTLHRLFRGHHGSRLYLSKANSASKVFHPKIYLFKSLNECRIISGSANMTEGGLINNKEASLLVNTKATDGVWIEAKKYFDFLINPLEADEVTLLSIKQYETFFEQHKRNNQKVPASPKKTPSQHAFDYTNLKKHFLTFDSDKRRFELNRKQRNYKEAMIILDKIADTPYLSQKEFEPLLDSLVGSKEKDSAWHSGSLHRLRKKIYPFYMNFRELIKYIRDNKTSPASEVFEESKLRVSMIEGAGINYITEIMMTYNPKEYANLNKNPLTVLIKEGGVNLKSTTASFTGKDYADYCELIKEIAAELDLENMLEADSFFNEIYWNIKE